jgi:hypothetical protein
MSDMFSVEDEEREALEAERLRVAQNATYLKRREIELKQSEPDEPKDYSDMSTVDLAMDRLRDVLSVSGKNRAPVVGAANEILDRLIGKAASKDVVVRHCKRIVCDFNYEIGSEVKEDTDG